MSNRCYVRQPDFVMRNIGGETVIVPVRSQVGDLDSIFTVNEVGTVIWERIDGKTSVDHIVDAICETFAVNREEAKKDTLEFLQSLHEAGLIRPAEAAEQKAPRSPADEG